MFHIGPPQVTLNFLLPEFHSRWILVYHGYYVRKATKLPIWNRMKDPPSYVYLCGPDKEHDGKWVSGAPHHPGESGPGPHGVEQLGGIPTFPGYSLPPRLFQIFRKNLLGIWKVATGPNRAIVYRSPETRDFTDARGAASDRRMASWGTSLGGLGGVKNILVG